MANPGSVLWSWKHILCEYRDNDPQLSTPCQVWIKMANLMGLGVVRCCNGNSCALLSLADWSVIDTRPPYSYRSQRQTFRVFDLPWSIITSPINPPCDAGPDFVFPKGRNSDRNALMNFDTFHAQVAARTMNTTVYRYWLVSGPHFYPLKIVFAAGRYNFKAVPVYVNRDTRLKKWSCLVGLLQSYLLLLTE